MARFRGSVGNTSRLASDSLMATAYGWDIGGGVFVYANDDHANAPKGPRGGWRPSRQIDNLVFSLDGGTHQSKHPLITVYANTDGNYSVFVNGRCVASNDSTDGMSEIGKGSTRMESTREAVERMRDTEGNPL